MPTEAPVKAPPKAPEKSPDKKPSPERYYEPKRLCPDQRRDAVTRTAPRK
jgi:hypothetical protein